MNKRQQTLGQQEYLAKLEEFTWWCAARRVPVHQAFPAAIIMYMAIVQGCELARVAANNSGTDTEG